MMNVASVRTKNGQAFHATTNNRETHVENRQRQREDRGDESSGDGSFVRILNRERANQKAEKVSAAIAEIDSRRRKIKTQEADQCANHSGGDAKRKRLAIEADVNQQAHQHEAN